MDSVTPHYDDTTSESLMSFHSNTLVGDVSLINQVIVQLIKTIDIDELMTTYYQQLKNILPLTAVSLSCPDRDITRGARSSNKNHPWFMQLEAPSPNTRGFRNMLCYWFSRELLLSEKQLALQLHDVFCHPLQHAFHVEQLANLATKDSLTGLGNRTAFSEDTEKLRLARLRERQNFGLLVVDLDNFKRVNDNHGHDEGDKVLCEAAMCLSRSLRANESAYRFGGDEFCCLLDTTSNNSVNKVAQRILHAIDSNAELSNHGVSASIGGTVSMPNESVKDTFKRADQALYRVKHQGKHGYLLS